MTIKEVYEKYKHCEDIMSFKNLKINSMEDQILYDLWQVIKGEYEANNKISKNE